MLLALSLLCACFQENCSVSGVGIDELAKNGELDFCRHAPLFWIDSADVGPTVGTAGAMTWTMKCTGFSGHSGVPQNAINALSLGMEAVKYIQQRFYADFPYSAEAAQWNFSNGSSLKPTRVSMPEGGQKRTHAHSVRGSGWGRRVGMGVLLSCAQRRQGMHAKTRRI